MKDDELLKIFQSAKFYSSFSAIANVPESHLPHVVFLGRSNSGKSSLINALTNQKNLVKVSKTPGKTRLLNFFACENYFYLVDVPGFGYSKASHREHSEMMKLLDEYLNTNTSIRSIYMLLDAQRTIPDEEYSMLQTAKLKKINTTLVRTKVDRLNQKEWSILKKDMKTFGHQVAYTSTIEGLGIMELRRSVLESVKGSSE